MREELEPQPDGGAEPYRPGLEAVFDVVRRLRAPGGCPWDREQTHLSLRPYLLEETYELLEALDAEDEDKTREELGDVLLQVAMHAEIAAQRGAFDAGDVSERVAAKMVSRHPHVFGDRSVASAEEVLRNWEADKARAAATAGRGAETTLDRVPRSLPALAWTMNLQKRAARVGYDPSDRAQAAENVAAQAIALAAPGGVDSAEEALGSLLYAAVTLARHLRVNPEDALRRSGARFKDRFDALERALRSEGRAPGDLEPGELERRLEEIGANPPQGVPPEV